MKKQVLSIALVAAMTASMSVPAFAATEVAKTDLAYKGDLEIMHFSTSEESEGNGECSCECRIQDTGCDSCCSRRSSGRIPPSGYEYKAVGRAGPHHGSDGYHQGFSVL